MNNKLSTLLAIIGCLTITQLGYAGGGAPAQDPAKVLAYKIECGAGMTNCTKSEITSVKAPSLNAAGDKVTYNTTDVTAEDLGTINATKTLSMKVPNSGKKIYSFTPTQGHRLIAGKPVKVLFVTFDLNQAFPAGTPASVIKEGTDAKTQNNARNKMVKVYNQKAGESQWTELVAYYTPENDLSNLKPVDFQINPDGKAVALQVAGDKLEADFGKLD